MGDDINTFIKEPSVTSRRQPPARLLTAAAALVVTAFAVGAGTARADDAAHQPAHLRAHGPQLDPAFCDGVVGYQAATTGFPESPEEIAAFVDDQVVPALELMVGHSDGELAASVEVLVDAFADLKDTGDPTPLFEDADILAAQEAIGEATHHRCELQTIDVLAADYSFGGIPAEIEAGRVSIAFVNDGEEEHELVLLRRPDDSTTTLDEYLAGDPGALFEQAEFYGVLFAAPAATMYTAIDLDPGTYFAICMIPTGGDPEAEPHSAHGMTATMVVTDSAAA